MLSRSGASQMRMEYRNCPPFKIGSRHRRPAYSETSIVEDEHGKKQKSIGFFEMFRFATNTEWLALFGGVLCCALMGLGVPVNMVLYGEFTILMMERSTPLLDSSTPTVVLKYFGGGEVLVNPTPEMQRDALLDDSLAYAACNIVCGVVLMLFGIVGIDLLNYAALKQISTIRRLLLRSMLRQDMSWYDTNTSTNFATKISEDVEKMKEGMGEKIGVFTYLVTSFFVSIIVAFIYGWKLTLVVMCSAPVIIITTAIVAKMQSTLTVRELQAYSTAGVVAEEVLGSIKTVIAFAGEEKERKRYAEGIKPAKHVGDTKGLYSGIGTGIMWFIVYVSYAIAFYYGVSLIVSDRALPIEDREYTPAVLIIVFFGVLAGAQNLGLTAPHLEAFSGARGAAVGIFDIMDRKSAIDSLSIEGYLLKNPKADIVFEDVHFHYPSRANVKVLQGFNLVVHFGETVALVGPSGCGKSSCIQLLQRLYDPIQGRITLGGRDIREFNVTSLRRAIGVVGQEPVLFGTTIYENIRYGRPECTKEEIEEAARDSNCHDFIKKLQNGYNTMVGERGAHLSGGQKQRIAIARALVRRPTILLLDEATSALDTKSQAKVQMALEKTRLNRTTFIVSHRLSTIANADKIIVMDQGQVVEIGTHEELIDQKKHYYNLVNSDVESETELKVSKSVRFKGLDSQHALTLPSTTSLKSRFEEDYEEEEEEEEVNVSKAEKVGFMRILKLNTPEWHFITLGCTAALVNGATLPFFAIVFGDIFGVLALEDGEEVMSKTKVYCLYFLIIGIVTGVCMFVQMYMFSISGTRLTARLRVETFSTMLRQEMGWFDDEKNSVGALGSRLAGECSTIQGATGIRVGSMLQAGSTMIIGLLIAFYYSWKLALVSTCVLPVVLMAMVMEARFTAGVGLGEKRSIESSSQIATEAISNIKTVASLCQERDFERRYLEEMAKVYHSARRKARMRGFIFSMGQMVPFLGYAVSLSYGGAMVANKEMPFQDVIIVSEALLFGSWMLGQALAYAPNVNSAIISAQNLFKLFDREPLISSSPMCKPLQNWKAEGNIVFDKVVFTYPNRSDNTVLRKLELEVRRGQTVALVGPSGSGKSTCIQLLQRFYDPHHGNIRLDGLDIVRDIPLDVLRSQLGLVGQEPVLFDRTIAENIQYGDNSRTVSVDEVIDAAMTANIHSFIVSLPTGYETRLGSKGTQLSGGQKQRIAIARALVRKPRVLLLDEATSALDAQSQKLVQEALDKASKGRTCITIAHRLNTIRGADVIFVLANGKVVESGSHEELMKADGMYRKLYIGEQQR